jgi:hypothetical protein
MMTLSDHTLLTESQVAILRQRDCSTCQAQPGEDCRTENGTRADNYFHVSRAYQGERPRWLRTDYLP